MSRTHLRGWLVTLICLLANAASASAPALPVKIYVVAGQSNMTFGIREAEFSQHLPAEYRWLKSAENDVLYYWQAGLSTRGNLSKEWVKLDGIGQRGEPGNSFGCEHVVAHALWKYWKSQDPRQRIAVIKVSQGATSLSSAWNPGTWGRPEGVMHRELVGRIRSGLEKLGQMGLTWEGGAFFWYQGEGDSNAPAPAQAYATLFHDLVNGASGPQANGDPLAVPGIRGLLRHPRLPVVVARISHGIKGSPGWGARETWEPCLNQVRESLVNFTRNHPPGAWVDVDDVPLRDFFHYTGENYLTIYRRFGEACLGLLQGRPPPPGAHWEATTAPVAPP